MVVDTSAILAILSDEPERSHFNELIAMAPSPIMSSGTYLETTIVTEARYGKEGVRDLKLFFAEASIAILPFDGDQAAIAADGFSRYGKGRHPAGLNFGDCFAYALAKKYDEPLLFKGDDFSRTDVSSATHP